jgi:type III restriction enzyme
MNEHKMKQCLKSGKSTSYLSFSLSFLQMAGFDSRYKKPVVQLVGEPHATINFTRLNLMCISRCREIGKGESAPAFKAVKKAKKAEQHYQESADFRSNHLSLLPIGKILPIEDNDVKHYPNEF